MIIPTTKLQADINNTHPSGLMSSSVNNDFPYLGLFTQMILSTPVPRFLNCDCPLRLCLSFPRPFFFLHSLLTVGFIRTDLSGYNKDHERYQNP